MRVRARVPAGGATDARTLSAFSKESAALLSARGIAPQKAKRLVRAHRADIKRAWSRGQAPCAAADKIVHEEAHGMHGRKKARRDPRHRDVMQILADKDAAAERMRWAAKKYGHESREYAQAQRHYTTLYNELRAYDRRTSVAPELYRDPARKRARRRRDPMLFQGRQRMLPFKGDVSISPYTQGVTGMRGKTRRGKAWMKRYLDPSSLKGRGGWVLIENRYLRDIIEGLEQAGLIVEG